MTIKTTLAALALSVAAPTFAFAGAGHDQLAEIAGVSSSEYSVAEITLLIDAQHAEDDEAIAFFLNHDNRNTPSATSAGATQYAKYLGVAPGSLSLAELSLLDEAITANAQERIDFYLDKANGVTSRADFDGGISAGHLQLAKIAGVNAADYSTAELSRLIEAQQANDVEEIRFLTK